MASPQYNKFQRRIRKLRASYRRRMFVVFILALAIGFAGGWFCNSYLSGGDKPGASDQSAISTPEPSPVAVGLEWDDPLEADPTEEATEEPTAEPTEGPTAEPVAPASIEATEEPTEEPTAEPTEEPTPEPTEEPTAEPTEEPTAEPTEEPTAEPTEEPTAEPTEEPTAEPTEEPTAEPTEEPTPEPTEEPAPEFDGSLELPVPVGAEFSFNMEVLADGTARKDAAETEYFTVPVTMSVVRSMDNEYYAATYSDSYMLKGNEAGCELAVTLGECEGLDELSMQSAVVAVLQNANGEVHPGYQFTNAEISGETDSVIATGSTATIYKRYTYDALEGLDYLTVSYYENGEMKTVYFSLVASEETAAEEISAETEAPAEEVTEPEAPAEEEADAPAEEAAAPEATEEPAEPTVSGDESYTVGSKGEGVMLLQNKLIELGYLTGKADGQFGQWTAGAVKEAQKDFGLEQTGIADAEFLEILYSK